MALQIVSTGFNGDAATYACPWCGTAAVQRLRPLGVSGFNGLDAWIEVPAKRAGERVTQAAEGVWRRAKCDICKGYVVWRDSVMIYPAKSGAPAPHELMPADVLDLYVEAGKVLPLSARAGAALIRAALERLIRHLDGDAGSELRLDDRIARLKSRVSEPLGQLLDVVRYLGNEALHGSRDDGELVYIYLNDSSVEIAELLFSAVNDLVDELLARPSAIEGVWSRLPEGVRATIERKRQAAEKAADGVLD